jgi:uncharacterized protein YggE
MRLSAFTVALALSIPGLAFAQASNPPDVPVVVAQGEALLKRMPDRAFLTIATEVRDGKAANARKKSAEAMTEIRAAVGTVGIAESAIRTSGFSLQPEMECSGGKPSVRNYVVRNQIEIRIDDLDKLADVIDAANTPKNVAITVGSPRYELKDKDAAEVEALRMAVQTAMARAKTMAAGAGQSLGAVQRIQQGGVSVSMPGQPTFRVAGGLPAGAGRGGGGGVVAAEPVIETPITPGELEIRANVTVTVQIIK